MSSLDELITKAKTLLEEGHSAGQIADELSLSTDTVTYLLTKSKNSKAKSVPAPKDVHIDWTNVSSDAILLSGIASMMLHNFEKNCHDEDCGCDDECDCHCGEIDCVVGIDLSGVPLATLMATENGIDLAIYHASKHNPEGTGSISGNFAKVAGKRCLIVDDCITTGNTLAEIVKYLKKHKAEPAGICVLFDKRGVKEIGGVPVYSLFNIKRID
ncbi:MAG TPA: orotate phosphoribosyltransferase-like protein [Methanocorpusculum sp.]|nr:orotate phosphoribosyltransferase-like protein [Methanocorpusculum sp.]